MVQRIWGKESGEPDAVNLVATKEDARFFIGVEIGLAISPSSEQLSVIIWLYLYC